MKVSPRFNLPSQTRVVSLFLVMLCGPALAQDADPEARSRAIIDRFISNLEIQASDLTLEIDKEYQLTEDNGTFSTTFDPVNLMDEEVSIGLGPVSVSITPGDEGLSQVDLGIGETITISDGDQEVARVSIGEQSGQGIWSDSLEAFASSDIQFVKLQLSLTDSTAEAELAGLNLSSNTILEDDQTWTSEGKLQGSSLTVSGPEGQRVELGSLTGDFTLSGSDYQRLLSFTKDLQALMDPEKLEAMEDDPAAAQAFVGELLEVYGFIETMEGTITFSELSLSQGDTALGALGSLSLSNDFSASDDGSALGFTIELSGLQTPMAPLPPQLLPEDIRLELGLTHIPNGLLEKLVEVGMASEGMSEEEQQAMMSQELLGMVMSSALGAYIRESYVAAPETRVDLNLEASVSPGSPFGAVGNVDLRLVGLDMVTSTTGLDQDPEVAPVLAMITAFSNRTEEDGKVVDSFALEVTAEGKLMLNGKDVSGMLMGGGAPPPDAEAGEEPSTE